MEKRFVLSSKYIILCLFLVAIVFLLVFKLLVQPLTSKSIPKAYPGQKNEAVFTYEIINAAENTFCYNVYRDGKLFIHQPSIPGLPGNEGFKSKQDAQKVARVIIYKIKKGEMPPSITEEEMKNLYVIK